MKKFNKRLICLVVSLMLIAGTILFAFATDVEPEIISSLKYNRLLSLKTYSYDNYSFGNANGMTIARSQNSLYALKVNDTTTQDVVLYYYPNFETNPSQKYLI